MTRRLLALLAVAAVAGAVAWLRTGGRSVTEVAAGDPIPDAPIVRLLPGTHGSFSVTRPGTVVEAAPGAVVRGPVEVLAEDVTLRGLHVTGGGSGITVWRVEGAMLEDVTIRGADLHGIEVVDASARITDCRVTGLTSPYAQGIEVRNATTRARTVVEGCRVDGGREGLVTHSARVEFRGNVVTGTTLRAVAITEMSEGVMEGNEVRDALGVGLYCGDMSHCEIVGNDVRGVEPDGTGVRSQAGLGAVGWYYSTLRLRDNSFDVAAPNPVRLTLGSIATDRFPLSIWPPGWRGAVPVLWVSGLSLLGLVLVRMGAGAWVRRRAGRVGPDAAGLRPGTVALVAAGLAVTSFHMLEHVVQVVQVYVLDAEVRSGLLGAVVDTEWVHLAYNVAVLAFAGWLWWLVRPGGGGASGRAAPWALAALAIQGYHVAEHVAKIAQHVALGVKVAPGLLGGTAGLVWFHFGINLAVFVGMAVPMVSLLRRRAGQRSESRRVPALPEAAPAT
ncbi:MAG: right-handed parallel beta-helix repeat-containing protein [Actinomycetota bacterium]